MTSRPRFVNARAHSSRGLQQVVAAVVAQAARIQSTAGGVPERRVRQLSPEVNAEQRVQLSSEQLFRGSRERRWATRSWATDDREVKRLSASFREVHIVFGRRRRRQLI